MSGEIKIYHVDTDATSMNGTQTWEIKATSREQARELFLVGECEFVAEELEVVSSSDTTIDDFYEVDGSEVVVGDGKGTNELICDFPMFGGPSIPTELAKTIYKEYSKKYGTSQSLERLKQRGGFGWAEVSTIFKK